MSQLKAADLAPYREMFVRDAFHRSEAWCSLANELLRLGMLARVLRGPSSVLAQIGEAARSCRDAMNDELAFAERELSAIDDSLEPPLLRLIEVRR